MIVDSNKTIVSRGCTLDVAEMEEWCQNNMRCSMCDRKNCNRQNFEFQSCFQCKGKDCLAVGGSGNFCDGFYAFDRRGCYTLINGMLVRKFCANIDSL